MCDNGWAMDLAGIRTQMELLPPETLQQVVSYAAEVRDVAARYRQPTFAYDFNEFAIIAAETLESLTRLGSEVDDCGNPFVIVGPPELPGEDSSTG